MNEDDVLSYDNYGSRQRIEMWEHKRRRMELGLGECDDDEADDTSTARRVMEAIAWCAAFALVVTAIFFAATN